MLGDGLKPSTGMTASTDDLARYEKTHFFQGEKDKQHQEANQHYKLRVVSGRGNHRLAEDICKILGVELGNMMVTQEASEQICVKNATRFYGDDVFIVQSLCESWDHERDEYLDLNTSCMELLMCVHALRLGAAKRITAVMPYYAYSRQDRKTKPRVPISASALAQLVCSMGVDRVMTVDLHCGQIQGFFHNTPVDNLPTHREFSKVIQDSICKDEGVTRTEEELTIVAPDANGVQRARNLANCVSARSIATCLKRHVNGETRIDIVGDVENQVCVIVDDLTDSGSTLCRSISLLQQKKAKAVYAVITHGVFSGDCVEKISQHDGLKKLIVTDTVNMLEKLKGKDKIEILSIAPMLAEAIERTHSEVSLENICS